VTLENLAMGHPAIAQAAVIGIAHPKWGERPLLVAVKKPRARVSEAQLLAFLRGKVVKWWLPDAVAFVDAMPHTAAGKIRKTELRKRFAGFRFKA
jgi:fatty-acyl-CoA synthase